MKSLRQFAAVALVSAGAGFLAGRCAPADEHIMKTGACFADGARAEESKLVGLVARRSVRQTARMLRMDLGTGRAGEAELEFEFMVRADGSMELQRSEASCGGRGCPGGSELPGIIGELVASELVLQPSGKECTLRIAAEVPPVDDSGRIFRIRPERTGTEL
jgi:hypothetical protein